MLNSSGSGSCSSTSWKQDYNRALCSPYFKKRFRKYCEFKNFERRMIQKIPKVFTGLAKLKI